jgi:large subunit ribosomal protein L17
MRHQKNTKKFKRTPEERKRLWIDLSRGLIENGSIVTFTARAKWFRPKFERLVTLVKRAGDNEALAIRRVRPYFSEAISKKLVRDIVPKLKDRNGGYSKLYKVDKDFNTLDKSIVIITE